MVEKWIHGGKVDLWWKSAFMVEKWIHGGKVGLR